MSDEGMLSENIRTDIEESVAEALDQTDLRAALEEIAPWIGPVPGDQNEVDLVVMWVSERRARSWPKLWIESDTFRPYIDGCIIASLQAQDLAAGRSPSERPLKDYQRDRLARWERQSAHENP